MSDEKLNLPREQFESLVSQPMELDALGTELAICFDDLKGPCKINTCYGDICKIVNALRDYSRMLRMVCEEWNLQGYHQAVYELHAEKLDEISKKYQAGIGYDYDKAVEKCRKRAAKRSDDVGGEAMAMAYLKAQRTAEAKAKADAAAAAPVPTASQRKKPELTSLKVVEVGHYEFFPGSIIFLVDVADVPLSIQTKAWQIDGEDFNADCFGICVSYSFEDRQFSIVVDSKAESPGNVYYIDSGGGKHWFAAELAQDFLKEVFRACVKVLEDEDCERKPAEQDAVKSAEQAVVTIEESGAGI